MKTFFSNFAISFRRWQQRGQAVRRTHPIPDPLEAFILTRRERRALAASHSGQAILRFSTHVLPL